MGEQTMEQNTTVNQSAHQHSARNTGLAQNVVRARTAQGDCLTLWPGAGCAAAGQTGTSCNTHTVALSITNPNLKPSRGSTFHLCPEAVPGHLPPGVARGAGSVLMFPNDLALMFPKQVARPAAVGLLLLSLRGPPPAPPQSCGSCHWRGAPHVKWRREDRHPAPALGPCKAKKNTPAGGNTASTKSKD